MQVAPQGEAQADEPEARTKIPLLLDPLAEPSRAAATPAVMVARSRGLLGPNAAQCPGADEGDVLEVVILVPLQIGFEEPLDQKAHPFHARPQDGEQVDLLGS